MIGEWGKEWVRVATEPVVLTNGCGIYEVGPERTRVFITDAGRFLQIEGRALTHDDLMRVYEWGRKEAAPPDEPEEAGP